MAWASFFKAEGKRVAKHTMWGAAIGAYGLAGLHEMGNCVQLNIYFHPDKTPFNDQDIYEARARFDTINKNKQGNRLEFPDVFTCVEHFIVYFHAVYHEDMYKWILYKIYAELMGWPAVQVPGVFQNLLMKIFAIYSSAPNWYSNRGFVFDVPFVRRNDIGFWLRFGSVMGLTLAFPLGLLRVASKMGWIGLGRLLRLKPSWILPWEMAWAQRLQIEGKSVAKYTQIGGGIGALGFYFGGTELINNYLSQREPKQPKDHEVQAALDRYKFLKRYYESRTPPDNSLQLPDGMSFEEFYCSFYPVFKEAFTPLGGSGVFTGGLAGGMCGLSLGLLRVGWPAIVRLLRR